MNTKEGLENFTWDDDSITSEIDKAFGIVEDTPTIKVEETQRKPNPKAEDDGEDEEDKEIQKLKEKAAADALAQLDDAFGDTSPDDPTETKPVQKPEGTSKLSGADFLIESLSAIEELDGFIETEGIETEEDKINAVVKSYDSYFETKFNELIDDADDTTKKFFDFIKNGGKGSDFISKYKDISAIPTFDAEKDQEKIIKYYQTKVLGVDEEDADIFVENLRDTNQLEKYSDKYLPKLNEKKEKEEAAFLAAQRQQKENDKASAEKYIRVIKDVASKITTVGDIKIGKKEAGELKDYILKGTVEVEGKFYSGFNVDLQKALSDPEKRFAIAKILKSDFKISEAVKKTDVINQVNRTLQRVEQTDKKGKQSFLDFL